MISKRLLVVILFVGMVFAVFYATSLDSSVDWEDGAPTASIRMLFVEVDDGGLIGIPGGGGQIDFEVNEDTQIGEKSSPPATTYIVDVDPVDPNAVYEIYFYLGATTSAISGYVGPIDLECAIYGNCTISGQPGSYKDGVYNLDLRDAQTTSIGVETDYIFDPTTTYYSQAGNLAGTFLIQGSYIDGSTFNIIIKATAPDGSNGWTNADVILNVNEVGSITVEITNITTEVVEP